MIIQTGSSNRSTKETRGWTARPINPWKRLGYEFHALMEEEHRIILQPVAGDLLTRTSLTGSLESLAVAGTRHHF